VGLSSLHFQLGVTGLAACIFAGHYNTGLTTNNVLVEAMCTVVDYLNKQTGNRRIAEIADGILCTGK